MPYNEKLLDQARKQWLVGDWDSLCGINSEALINHPDRARIAILAAAGKLQTGNVIEGRKLVFLAENWGLGRSLIAKILNAGAINSLGKAAVIAGNHALAIKYFEESIRIIYDESEIYLFARERFYNECNALAIEVISGGLQIDFGETRERAIKYRHEEMSVGFAENDLLRSFGYQKNRSGKNNRLKSFKELIFCHSLWRSGSTFIFKKFRESDAGIWAYQEPLHEVALYARDNPSALAVHVAKEGNSFRHPVMEKPYFYELYQVSDSWIGTLRKEMILDDYFQIDGHCSSFQYFNAIINAAMGIPFIQECRTSNRIKSLKENFGGYHIYLWRNPWDQWQSFKVDSYFENMLKMISCCVNAPPFLKYIAETSGIKARRAKDFYEEVNLVHKLQLTPSQSYLIFYAIWWLALNEALHSADILINIDKLSSTKKYREELSCKLRECCGVDIDFSDCKVPQAEFLETDIKFFSEVEVNFIETLGRFGGYTDDIKRIDGLRNLFNPKA